MTNGTVVTLWIESLQAAYGIARGERLNELRGTKTRWLDERGAHPLSLVWGRVEAMQDLEPVLGQDGVATSLRALVKAAREDAEDLFRTEILEAAA